jgi:hypothetical protein
VLDAEGYLELPLPGFAASTEKEPSAEPINWIIGAGMGVLRVGGIFIPSSALASLPGLKSSALR